MKSLGTLIREIDSKFRKKKQRIHQHTWCLVRLNDGMWQIKVYDDWHKWMDEDIEELRSIFSTPEEACIQFLNYIESKKINLKRLQS